MRRCVNCSWPLWNEDEVCPKCGTPPQSSSDETVLDEATAYADGEESATPDSQAVVSTAPSSGREEPMAPIARFHNVAEAGYFAHELMLQADIPATVNMDESFEALGGYWSTRFLLSVPRSQVEAATHRLQRLIERTELEEPAEFEEAGLDESVPSAETSQLSPPGAQSATAWDGRVEPPDEEEGGVHWVPIVLTLAAGSAAFWGFRKLNDAPQPDNNAARPQQADLWDELGTFSEPWVQDLDNGEGVRKLWIDRRQGTLVIREDLNGDGNFEKEVEFQRAMLER